MEKPTVLAKIQFSEGGDSYSAVYHGLKSDGQVTVHVTKDGDTAVYEIFREEFNMIMEQYHKYLNLHKPKGNTG